MTVLGIPFEVGLKRARDVLDRGEVGGGFAL